MWVPRSGHAFSLLLTASLVAGQAPPGLTAQARGGGGFSTSRVASPTVLAAGDRTFELDFELGKETKFVRMLGQNISLQAVNVIVVDDADSASAPRIVGVRRSVFVEAVERS